LVPEVLLDLSLQLFSGSHGHDDVAPETCFSERTNEVLELRDRRIEPEAHDRIRTRVVPEAPQRFCVDGFPFLFIRYHEILLPRPGQQRDFRERIFERTARVLELFFFYVRAALLR
jgi:hypothetical protein